MIILKTSDGLQGVFMNEFSIGDGQKVDGETCEGAIFLSKLQATLEK